MFPPPINLIITHNLYSYRPSHQCPINDGRCFPSSAAAASSRLCLLYLRPQSCLPPRPYCSISCHPRRAASHIKSVLLALTCVLRLNLHITQEILLYPSTNHLLSLAQGCPLCLFYGMLLINIVDTSYHSDKKTQALAKMQNGHAEHLPLSILSSMRLLCLRYKH